MLPIQGVRNRDTAGRMPVLRADRRGAHRIELKREEPPNDRGLHGEIQYIPMIAQESVEREIRATGWYLIQRTPTSRS